MSPKHVQLLHDYKALLEAQLHEIATLEKSPNKACSRRIRTNRAAIIAVGKELAKAQVEAGV